MKENSAAMLTVNEALDFLVRDAKAITETEWVDLSLASGRILAEDIYSDIMVPASDNAAMDGYAFRFSDIAETQGQLTVSQRIPAGKCGQALQLGEAARIFTGAPIPDGADTVIRQEWCQVEGDILSLHRLPHKGDCIRYAGEDIKQKQFVLKKGTYLNAQHLGLLAVIGKKSFKVFRRLKVALLVTGSELVDPGEKLSPGKIYNSNQYVLKALLAHFGCSIIESKMVPDDFSATRSELKAAAEKVDFILTSGGVSVGEEDHVKPVIQAEGKIHFWRIAVKPGKPVVYGAINSSQKIGVVPIIGLPGNPVSAFVTFLLFVRPYLLKMQGMTTGLPHGFLVKSADTYLSSEDRREFLRAKLNQEGAVEFFPNQGSGVSSSMVWGDGLVDNPAGHSIQKGELVHFIPFSMFFFS